MGTVILKIEEVRLEVYVRTKLNETKVLEYAELMEAKVNFPPIEVNQDNIIIDGRHRYEAAKLCSHDKIACTVTRTKDEADLISRAYRANAGGSLPPSREDTEHTIMSLLERGTKADDIAPMLNVPPSIAKKYIATVKSKIKRGKLVRAAAEVAAGKITVDDAASKYGLKPKDLGEFIEGNPTRKASDLEGLKRGLTISFTSSSHKSAGTLKRALDRFEDGDLSEKQVRAVFKHLSSLQERSSKAMEGWLKRFEAMIASKKGGNKVEAAATEEVEG